MVLNHIGIINENEEQAERFYGAFLGLDKTREFYLPLELAEQLFDYSHEIKMMVFENDGIKVEVFICSGCSKQPSPDFRHIGLFVDDLFLFMEKASQLGVEQIVGKTKEKTVHFIKDFYGNMIEVKQK